MITLLQLEYFCALAKEEHLTKTAEKLFVSQSTLSYSISKLERELGTPLFDRIKNRMVLNQYGKAYLAHVSKAIQEIRAGENSIRELQQRDGNSISLAASHSSLWLETVNGFRETHPEIYIRIRTENLATYRERLMNGKLDFVITGEDDLPWEELDSVSLGAQKLCLAMAPQHPLSGRAEISLKELGPYAYVDLAEELSFRIFCDRIFEAQGVSINRICECESAMRPAMLRENLGIALTVDTAANRSAYEGLCFVPLKERELERRIALFWKSGRQMPPVMEEFKDYICREAIDFLQNETV